MLPLLAVLLFAGSGLAVEKTLPVFLADNHAETFAWITRTFEPDDEHVLVLVDAHTDASAAERSEELREGLRRVPSLAARDTIVRGWRDGGRVQAFNWVEPLMPRPIGQVRWVAGVSLDEKELKARTIEAVESLDGRLEIEPRSAGSFAGRWQTFDMAGFTAWDPPDHRPVILAIDLDFFAGMSPADRENHFHAIWKRAMDWPRLAGVAFAVSRPWLMDDAEADALVSLAATLIRHTPASRLEIDSTPDITPDHSLNAARSAKPPARWDLGKTSAVTIETIAALGDRLKITDRSRPALMAPAALPEIAPVSGEMDCDHVWRFPIGQEPVLRLQAPAEATGNVRWQFLQPARTAYDLLPHTSLGKGFSQAPARWIYHERRALAVSSDFQLDPSVWKNAAGGRFLITADYETSTGWLPAGTIDLRIRNQEGFRGSLSECFGMSYVFGIGLQTEGDLSGVETGLGSDCANFLVHAWRRNGLPLTWGDPGRLRGQLGVKGRGLTPDSHPIITAREIETGLAIDFGRHMAAVWEDRDPIGVLDGNDLVTHHLGGFPEIVPLAKLAADRPPFSLLVPRTTPTCRVAIAGDVVLAGHGEHVTVEGFGRSNADLFLANLEGIPSLLEPPEKSRYDFRFPPARLDLLVRTKVDAVSLANNHALDAGADGLVDGIHALKAKNIPFTGAGMNEQEACQPWIAERGGVKLAVFGVSIVGSGAAGPDTPGIAMLPQHGEMLAAEFREARAQGRRIIVMLHGGDEYRTEVNEEQRHWARWIAARGAALVAGSHPHVVQREETHAGMLILHSLGNAVYPRDLSGTASGKVRIVEIASP